MKKLIVLMGLLLLSACSSEDEIILLTQDASVIVAARAPDYSSGALSAISEDSDNVFSSINELSATGSDIVVRSYGSHFYVINRSDENITKYAFSDPSTAIWQFTTKNDAADTFSNPHSIVFVNETKAYVLRYGKTTAWIVNPSATNASEFKIGELDLSLYGDVDGIPDMDNGVVANGYLFITLQRLENYIPANAAYVAVFDVITDQEVETGYAGDALKGIPLSILNPSSNVVYEPVSGLIYVSAVGSYGFSQEDKYVGGIETIDVSSFATNFILDDGSETVHPYGNISGFAIVSATRAYFIGYVGWGENYLYTFNPSTGDVAESAVSNVQAIDIAFIVFDGSGRLWLADASNASVHIINAETDSLIDSVSTVLSPLNIVFAQ